MEEVLPAHFEEGMLNIIRWRNMYVTGQHVEELLYVHTAHPVSTITANAGSGRPSVYVARWKIRLVPLMCGGLKFNL